ncbi:MAG: permease [Anaerolineaceae bacterium]|nr:permease [Anaerolineaceae bacterium]
MENVLQYLGPVLWSGWTGLLDYLAAHVLLCLVPAFIIAGFMSSMIPKETITRFLGPKASKWISYPASALGGFILAVCSCTILPLFAGIWKRGAGLGPAITFLFVGPAINILAITYTGAAIGADIAFARLFLSIFFGILIGILMAWFFRKEEEVRSEEFLKNNPFESKATVKTSIWVMFLLLFSILIVGTLKIDLFTNVYFSWNSPLTLSSGLNNLLQSMSLTGQGSLLILMLALIGISAYRGLENVLEGFNIWTVITMILVAVTILIAAPNIDSVNNVVGINGRFLFELLLIIAVGVVGKRSFSEDEIGGWLWESWKFVKQIFPLLIIGVFAAGMVKVIIPQGWVENLAGNNTIMANLIGVLFGVFMYFPTLVEVPIAKMFLDLGMARGPLLAYLLADPELSIQSILVVNNIMGKKKTGVYVLLVTIFSTLAGYLFGVALTLF